jgi:Tfp pilus assembly protein PilF
MRRLPVVLLAAALSGCAALQDAINATRAQVTLVEGLRQFDAGKHEDSAKSLAAALESGGLGKKDEAAAHKHLAFIHCTAQRERQCRDEFRKALVADPQTKLDAAEASHPVWGPIFRSMSGPDSLTTGLRQYEQGEFDESAKNLQGAIDLGVPEKERATAHKHLAFIHCASNREKQCRDEFRKALAVDPELELAPEEAGHPVWGPIFKAVKAGR